MKQFTTATENAGIGFSIHISQINKNLGVINFCPY